MMVENDFIMVIISEEIVPKTSIVSKCIVEYEIGLRS